MISRVRQHNWIYLFLWKLRIGRNNISRWGAVVVFVVHERQQDDWYEVRRVRKWKKITWVTGSWQIRILVGLVWDICRRIEVEYILGEGEWEVRHTRAADHPAFAAIWNKSPWIAALADKVPTTWNTRRARAKSETTKLTGFKHVTIIPTKGRKHLQIFSRWCRTQVARHLISALTFVVTDVTSGFCAYLSGQDYCCFQGPSVQEETDWEYSGSIYVWHT
jgi:hypothetical protein